ncbi:hypothetical protein FZC84_22735 [Rossellomorea vietnamensis]|uniref:Uncharacterized protein n=1 Tax=Rossellomorea vietnamensis TaxID=218284 RepID=A0A5D4LZ95_9BACI|nr:FxLYD domain-containing protein [Rossellomorea vietnamensis]TYR94170.1 hypothetical protein FZC84_22735 [Rossellomorea vietnamensis]
MFAQRNLTVNQWILVIIILCIPLINLVFLLVWALSSTENESVRNFSRAVIKLHLILIGVTVAVFIGLGGSLAWIGSNEPTGGTGSMNSFLSLSGGSETESHIQFGNIVHRANMGITTISGETTNTDDQDHSYSAIITFYDSNKQIVGTGMAIIDNIGPGQTKTFETITTDNLENATSYKADVDSIIY